MTKKERDHFNLLCDMGDLAALLNKSSDVENFLQSTTGMVSRYLNADACSIFLYDERLRQLVLRATAGLALTAVGRVRMKSGEGLVGTTFETLQPIRSPRADLDSGTGHFKEMGGGRFASFLSVPILRGSRKIGVLVVQHENEDYFNQIDVVILRALSSQLAGTIENAHMMAGIHLTGPGSRNSDDSSAAPPEDLRFVKGESASGGYAYAAAAVFKRSHGSLLTDEISDSGGKYSLEDFYRAVQKTSEQLIDFQTRLAEQLLESASLIFDAHFMILKDAKFINKIVRQIMEGIAPPKAIKEVTRHYIEMFSSSSNEYIREKVNDMEDLAGRILKNLYNWSSDDEVAQHRIVIASDLYPSEVLRLASEDVKGIVLVRGGVTSHVSILARSLRIPLVIADHPKLLLLPEGTRILLDGEIGNIYVRPAEDIVMKFRDRKKSKTAAVLSRKMMEPVTRTRDGVRVVLLANINLLSELSVARELKAEGIGLYRTEFPFLIRSAFPSEEEQYLVYKRVFDEMPGQEITIRTLDVGGDKSLSYADSGGTNPELGLRSIRFSLRHRDIFEQQIRAILRAGADAPGMRILFPMISSIDEFREAKQIVAECVAGLDKESLPCHPDPLTGIMVETPSVLELLDEFAREAAFFSVGTNDFVQYMLAVDRSDKKVAGYYQPCHPAVLRGLAKIVRAGIRGNIPVSVCGEMAHESEYIPFLLGVGVRRISADPQFLPRLQRIIKELSLSDAERYAHTLLAEPTLEGTLGILKSEGSERSGKWEVGSGK